MAGGRSQGPKGRRRRSAGRWRRWRGYRWADRDTVVALFWLWVGWCAATWHLTGALPWQ